MYVDNINVDNLYDYTPTCVIIGIKIYYNPCWSCTVPYAVSYAHLFSLFFFMTSYLLDWSAIRPANDNDCYAGFIEFSCGLLYPNH